jgi:hypothetical protein
MNLKTVSRLLYPAQSQLDSTLFDLPCAMRFGTFRDPLEWQRVVADLGVNDDTQLAFSFAYVYMAVSERVDRSLKRLFAVYKARKVVLAW